MMLMSLLNVKLSGRVIQTHEHFRDVRARAFFFFYTEVHEHNMLKLGGILPLDWSCGLEKCQYNKNYYYYYSSSKIWVRWGKFHS